jgi:hypothetical protein
MMSSLEQPLSRNPLTAVAANAPSGPSPPHSSQPALAVPKGWLAESLAEFKLDPSRILERCQPISEVQSFNQKLARPRPRLTPLSWGSAFREAQHFGLHKTHKAPQAPQNTRLAGPIESHLLETLGQYEAEGGHRVMQPSRMESCMLYVEHLIPAYPSTSTRAPWRVVPHMGMPRARISDMPPCEPVTDTTTCSERATFYILHRTHAALLLSSANKRYVCMYVCMYVCIFRQPG